MKYSEDDCIMEFFAKVSFYQRKLLKIQQVLIERMGKDFRSFVEETDFHLLVKNMGKIFAGISIPMPDPVHSWHEISEKYKEFEKKLIINDKLEEWFFYPEKDADAEEKELIERKLKGEEQK